MTPADRIIVLKGGAVEQAGTPLALYDQPHNAFIAGFIGSPAMNFLRGRVQRADVPFVLTDDGVWLPLLRAPNAAHGPEVLYGARPEHFTIGKEHGLHADVVLVQATGAEMQVTARWGGMTSPRPFACALKQNRAPRDS
jgi:multiple sugar transport system ATP-binding protein